jgi:hypothetical protein
MKKQSLKTPTIFVAASVALVLYASYRLFLAPPSPTLPASPP